MTPVRKQKPGPAVSAAGPTPPSGTSTRKPWVKKSPVEVVLDQIRKQEERVAGMQEELNREKRELEKLQKAKDVLEGK